MTALVVRIGGSGWRGSSMASSVAVIRPVGVEVGVATSHLTATTKLDKC